LTPQARDFASQDNRFAAEGIIFKLLDQELEPAQRIRRELHRHPDVSGRETPTLERVLSHLPEGGSVTRFPFIAALVSYGPPGARIAIRAELDALPIIEDTGVGWASTNGAMHTCGHDVHMAALVALSRAIIAAGPAAPAPFTALLQPREETVPPGALDIVRSGALAREHVRAVIGAHVQPALNSHEVSSVGGTVNAASDEFTLTVTGVSGHGAYPHLTADPLLAASSIVVGLQQIAARNVDPMRSAVVSTGSIHGGSVSNAIPETVTVTGTIRTTSPTQQQYVHTRIAEIAGAIATAHRCTAETQITPCDPLLVNDATLAAETAAILQAHGISTAAEFRSFGADDFAYYGQVVPSLMIFTGTRSQPGAGLHSSRYLPDDDAVRRIAYSMAAGYIAAARAFATGASGADADSAAPADPLQAL
jgi:amidohydrolase